MRRPLLSAHQRGYGAAWRKVRLRILWRDQWTCHWCRAPANTVDHVVPLAEGGARYDPANLVAACRPCNTRRGAQLGGRRGAAAASRNQPNRRVVHYGAIHPDDVA